MIAETPRQPLTPDQSAPVERTVADLGGLENTGPVVREEPELTLKDKRIDAMSMLLRQVDERFTSDTSRRAQEELEEPVYDTINYYDRWLLGVRTNLVNLGFLTDEEIDAKIEEVKARYKKLG